MIRRYPLPRLLFFALLLSLSASLTVQAQQDTDSLALFRSEIYPMLKEHCFKCHGEGDKLKSGFRITNQQDLFRGGDRGPAYDEANPSASLLLKAISYEEDDYQMPPKNKLSDDDISMIRKWLESGAAYDPGLEIAGKADERHKSEITEQDRKYWAYQPVKAPVVKDPSHAIDELINHKLEEQVLAANPRADRRTLIRRAYYNLLGLPPSPEAVEKFVADRRSDQEVWNSLIDELLDRPQYGEKWARHWLDLVRYAESNGFERDNPKPEIWRYRDYVVDAFNSGKTYDRFIIEQLAGDEIENPTEESLTATGFHRLMQWDDEPADRKQHVYDVLADNVQTTAEAFLATTMNCTRCHDHKADPFTQKDYYSFMAFFAGITHYQTPGTIVHWASEEEKRKFASNRTKRITELESKLAHLDTEIRGYLENNNLIRKVGTQKPRTLIDDARGNGASWEYTTDKPTPDWKEVGFRNKSWVKGKSGFGREGTPGSVVHTRWHSKEIWMRASFGLAELPSNLTLDIHHDEDVEVYLNGQEIYRARGYQTDYKTIVLGKVALQALQTGRNILAIHCKQTAGGQYIDAALRTGQLLAEDAPLTRLVKVQGKTFPATLARHFKRPIWKEYQDTEKAIQATRNSEAGTRINSVTEIATAPAMHVHRRGSAHALGDPVVPGFPAVLSGSEQPSPASFDPRELDGRKSSGRRLALAQWIASPQNPLTARVMVNRLWQHHFGRGIVPSANDFGKLGEDPSHPDLLDWLAAEFIKQDWSIKDMHRIIMKSEAYQRSSAPHSDNLVKDPANKLLWRFNMRRLTAEELRDSMLSVAGTLNLDSGGPWVYPPLPQAVLATASRPGAGWPVSPDAKNHVRRSLYIHVKRSLRHPMMVDFDQADTDAPCAVRFATTVPNQALNLLNSKFVNDQATTLTKRLLEECGGDLKHQLSTVLALVMQRQPDEKEVSQLQELHSRLQAEAGLSADQALERIALLALNLNEFAYLD